MNCRIDRLIVGVGIFGLTCVSHGALPVTNGLALWLDAGALAGLTNNQPVAVWPDQAPLRYDAAQTNALRQPLFVTNVINGRPVVRFDGVNDYLDGPASNVAARTVFVVSLVQPSAVLFSGVFAQKGADAWNIRSTNGTWNAPGNVANFADFSMNGQSAVNGRPGFTHRSQFHVLAQVAATTGAFQYRLSQTLYSRYFKGDLAELILYNRALTAAELGQVGYHLAQKYGLAAAYPVLDNENGPTAVTAAGATLNGRLNAVAGAVPTTVRVFWGPQDGGAAPGAWAHTNVLATVTAPQTFAQPVTGFGPASTGYYRYQASNAVDGAVWAPATAAFRTDFSLAPGGVALWLAADALPGVTNGAALDFWPDLSGSSRHAVLTRDSERPLMVTNALNGRPVVRNGAGKTLALSQPLDPMGRTLFLVYKQAAAQTAWTLALGGNLHTTTLDGMFCLTIAGGAFTINSTVSAKQFAVNTLQTVAGNYELWIDGASAGSAVSASALTALSRVGNTFEGDLAEVLAIDGTLTPAARGEVEFYLARKYGLAGTFARVDNGAGATRIGTTGATLNGSLGDTDGGTPTAVQVCWGPTDGGAAFGAWAHTNGWAAVTALQTFALDVTGLQPYTAYRYRFYASNAVSGSAWAPSTASFVTSPHAVTNGLQLWLDAAQIAGVTNGGAVATWTDGSGNAQHAVQANATLQPRFYTNAIGGRPVVRFDGANDYLDGPPAGLTAQTVFMVLKLATNAVSLAGVFARTGGSDTYNIRSGLARWNAPEWQANTADFCWGGNVYVNGARTSWHNNQYHILEEIGGAAGTFPYRLSQTFQSRLFKGDLAETLIYNRALTLAERGAVTRYLERKYDIAGSFGRVENGGATPLAATTATLNGHVNDTDFGATTTVRVCWGRADGGGAFGGWAQTNDAGAVTQPQSVPCALGGLTPGVRYYYRFSVSNAVSGLAWASSSASFVTWFSGVTGGLQLWLAADSLEGVTNGGAVAAWPDLSGNVNHATQGAAAAQPRYVTSALGGQPAVRFDGTSDYLDGPANNLTAQTIFMVLKLEATAPSLSGAFCQKGADAWNVRNANATTWRTPANGANVADFNYNGAVYVNGSATATHANQYHILEEVAAGAGSFQYRLSQILVLGGAARYLKGDLAETIVFNRTLTRAERGEVGRYLAAKYGFKAAAYGTSVLPAGAADPLIWYDLASQVNLTNGLPIATLVDYSGYGNHASQATNSSGICVTNAVGGLPVVRLDGADAHYYTFPVKNNIRTVFWVLKEDAAATGMRFLLGDTSAGAGSTYGFHRDTSAQRYIWDSTHAPLMFNGATKLNGVLVDGRVTPLPTQPAILSVRTSGNATANNLSRDRTSAGRNWQGDVAELLVYSRVLSDAEEAAVGLYLAGKYGLGVTYSPVVNLAATRMARTSATLNGAVTQASADDPTTVAVYWGTADGGTNVAAWATNRVLGSYTASTTLSLPVANLVPLTTHYYRFRGTRAAGTAWADATEAFRTPGHAVTNGLQLWLDASAVTGVADGGRVAQLSDWSGFKNHARQAAAARQPVFKPSVTNGQALLRFDNATNYLDGVAALTAKSILIVCKVDADAPLLSGVFAQQGADLQNVRCPTAATWTGPGNGPNNGDFALNGAMAIDGRSGFTHNNRLHLLHAVSAGAPNFAYRLSQMLVLNGRSRFFKGDLAEVLIYNRALTLTEQYELGKYVQGRYGLAVRYPVIELTGIGAVGQTQAAVNGNNTLPGAAVRLYYGTVNGGEDTNAWQQSTGMVAAAGGAFSLIGANLQPDTTYYARYYATNAQDFGWSPTLGTLHTQPDLPVTDGLSLWFAASALTGYADGARVPTWPDLSGNGRNGTAPAAGNPVFKPNAAGTRPVVRFDGGTNTYYTFTRLDTIRTVFWVLREDADATFPRFLLGSEGIGDIFHFHRDTTAAKCLWNASASANVRNGVTRLDGVTVNGLAAPLPADRLAIISVRTVNNCTANAFSSDRWSAGVRPGRTWDGDLAELLIYNRALTDDEERLVGLYLEQRYGLRTSYSDRGMLLIVR